MPKAKKGDTVRVHYTGHLEDGTIFDSSAEREPLEFTLGRGTIIPGFEAAVEGMEVGEKKTQIVTYDDAYGPHMDEMVKIVERATIPEDMDIEVGQHLQITGATGESVIVTIVEITDEDVTLDGNHPLAGQDLIFDIELVEIVES
jgi:peptidylprolyl isomerase